MQQLFIILYLTVLGLVLGSFLHVVAYRIPRGESILLPPSHCADCHHRLRLFDLIPIISYLLIKGRCRYCDIPLSPLYVYSELITSCLFVLLYLHFGLSSDFVIGLLYVSFLVTISLSDLLYKIIPNKVTYPSLILFLLIRVFEHPLPLSEYLFGLLIGGGIFYLIAIFSPGGMGGGDIKLMSIIGIVTGWKLTLLTILIASLLGTIIGGVLLMLAKIKRNDPIPLGPFIAIGAVFAYLFGNSYIEWYLSSFNS